MTTEIININRDSNLKLFAGYKEDLYIHGCRGPATLRPGTVLTRLEIVIWSRRETSHIMKFLFLDTMNIC